MTIQSVFRFASIWSILLPLCAGIFKYKNAEREIKIIIGIVAFATIPQVMDYFFSQDSEWLTLSYNVYTPIEFIFFGIFFKSYLKSQNELLYFLFINLFYIIVSIILLSYFNLSEKFIYEWVCLNNILYIVYVYIIFLRQYTNDSNDELNFSLPVFWIFTGIFIYSSFSSITLPIRHYLMSHKGSYLSNFLIIHHLSNTVLYIFFCIGIYMSGKSKIEANKKSLTLEHTK